MLPNFVETDVKCFLFCIFNFAYLVKVCTEKHTKFEKIFLVVLTFLC